MSDAATDSRTVDRLVAAMTATVAAADRARGTGLPAAQVLVRAPGFEFAAGERGRRFHAASVGKAITATRAYQLAEGGRLDLDAPLTSLIPQADTRGLFVRGGVDHARDVTAAHLLAHTSGVADYFKGRAKGAPRFAQLLWDDPDRIWTPSDLLAFSADHQQPVAVPGRRFSYSDTGFVLLGRVIEEAGGDSLGRQLHDGVFEPAGMSESCLLFHTLPGGGVSTLADPAVQLDIAPLWLGRHEFSRARSLSCDWGGGGIVTTLDDLVRFTTAWSTGALVGQESKDRMATAKHRFRPGIRYGSGLMRLHYEGFSPLVRGMPRPVGHLGITAAHAFAVPELGIHIAMNFHSTREMVRSFRVQITLMRRLLRALRD